MSNTLAKLLGMGGGGTDVWVSGATVERYSYVISPLDLEVYQRKTATGSGSTDPANDLTNYRAASYNRPAVISNAWSSGALTNASNVFATYTRVVSPTLSTSVKTTLLSITGGGSLQWSAISSRGVANTSVFEVVLDGRTLYSASHVNPDAASRYAIAVGSLANGVPLFEDMRFVRSCEVFITPNTAGILWDFTYAYRGYV